MTVSRERVKTFALVCVLCISSFFYDYSRGDEDPVWVMLLQSQESLKQRNYQQAEAQVQQAMTLYEASPNKVELTKLGILSQQFNIRYVQGLVRDAEPYAKEALVLAKRLSQGQPVIYLQYLDICSNLGFALMNQEKLSESEAVLRECLPAESEGEPSEAEVQVSSGLAEVLRIQKKYSEAESLIRKVLDKLNRAGVSSSVSSAKMLAYLGPIIQRQSRGGNRLVEAEAVLRQALAIYQKLVSTEEFRYLYVEQSLAHVLLEKRQLEEAETLIRHVAANISQQFGPSHVQTALANAELAMIYSAQGRYNEAEPLLKMAHLAYKKAFGNTSSFTVDVQALLVDNLKKQGKNREAQKFERANGVWVVR